MKKTEDPKYKERVEKNMSLKPGDKVTIHDCFEADLLKGQSFEVRTKPDTICGTPLVFLKGVGCFEIGYLEKEGYGSDKD